MRDVFVHPSGQDDNLGDSALRTGLLEALRVDGARLHVLLAGQTPDYVAGIPLAVDDVMYTSGREWRTALRNAESPFYALNAGEINPIRGRRFPARECVADLRAVARRRGTVVAAGLGLREPQIGAEVRYDAALVRASLVSWRDRESQRAVGFGDIAPDWAFALGSAVDSWVSPSARSAIAVTLRFDRPWPGDAWLTDVRTFARRVNAAIVTVAQVARDAPRAVHLAEALGGEYRVAPTMRHDDLDRHVRTIYAGSLAVVSDRAHALILGATEGAYPLGSAQDPRKIHRILDAAHLGSLTGRHAELLDHASRLEAHLGGLPEAINYSRREVGIVRTRLRRLIAAEG